MLGTFLGEGNGYPLHYSGLENSMDCLAHGVAKSRTRLSNLRYSWPCWLIDGLRNFENSFLFKTPGLWKFVTAAPGHSYGIQVTTVRLRFSCCYNSSFFSLPLFWLILGKVTAFRPSWLGVFVHSLSISRNTPTCFSQLPLPTCALQGSLTTAV